MIGTPISVVLSVLIHCGEFSPNVTRNQIQPYWVSYGTYGYADSGQSGYWNGQPDDNAFAILSDLRTFGVSSVQAEANYRIAADQLDKRDEIWCHNREWVFYQWEADVRHRRIAWSYLSTALDLKMSHDHRLRCLDNLRVHIGDESYFGGIMPAPSPNYNVNDTTWKDRR